MPAEKRNAGNFLGKRPPMLQYDSGREQNTAQCDRAMLIHQKAIDHQNEKGRDGPQAIGRDHHNEGKENKPTERSAGSRAASTPNAGAIALPPCPPKKGENAWPKTGATMTRAKSG